MHTYTYTYNETTFHAEETTLKIKKHDQQKLSFVYTGWD